MLPLVAAGPARAGAPITQAADVARQDTLRTGAAWRSPGEATRRSAHATLVPVAVGAGAVVAGVAGAQSGYLVAGGCLVVAGGLVFGPAAGYYYGGLPRRGNLGVAARLLVVAGPPLAAAWSQHQRWGDRDWSEAGGALLGGLAAGAALAVLDVAVVGGDVRRRNEAGAARALSLAPAVAPFSHAPGIAARVALPSGGE